MLLSCGCCGAQRFKTGPWRFGIHKVGGYWRYTPPIIDPRIDKMPELPGAQIRRRLNADFSWQLQPRLCHRPQQLLKRRVVDVCHARTGLGTKVLDDDFLNVAVALVKPSDILQITQALFPRLPNTDQQPCCHGDPQRPRARKRKPTAEGKFVRRTIMGAAFSAQSLCTTFQHQAHGRGNRSQSLELRATQRARIHMRQQPRVLNDLLRHRNHVVDRCCEPAVRQPFSGRSISTLWLLAQGQEHFTTTGGSALTDGLQNLLYAEVQRR